MEEKKLQPTTHLFNKSGTEIDFSILPVQRFIHEEHINYLIKDGFLNALRAIYEHLEKDNEAFKLFMSNLVQIDDFEEFYRRYEGEIRLAVMMITEYYYLIAQDLIILNRVHSFNVDIFSENIYEVKAEWKKGIHGLVELAFPEIEFDDSYTVMSLEIALSNLSKQQDKLTEENPIKQKIESLCTLADHYKEAGLSREEEIALSKALRSVSTYLKDGDVETYNTAIIQAAEELDASSAGSHLVVGIMLTILALSLIALTVALIAAMATPAAPASVGLLASVIAFVSNLAIGIPVAVVSAAGAGVSGFFGVSFFKQAAEEHAAPSFKKLMKEIRETRNNAHNEENPAEEEASLSSPVV